MAGIHVQSGSPERWGGSTEIGSLGQCDVGAYNEYLSHQNATDMEMHYFPQAELLDLIARQGCKVLEIREDDSIGLSVIAISNTLLLQKLG